MYHLQPTVSHRLIRAKSQLNGRGGRTCEVDPNRVHELGKESGTAAAPLVDGNTPGSGMEREEFNQVSC